MARVENRDAGRDNHDRRGGSPTPAVDLPPGAEPIGFTVDRLHGTGGRTQRVGVRPL